MEERPSKHFKQFTCGWAMFQAESDDELTDGWCARHEEMEEVEVSEREDGSELEEWEGGGGDEVIAGQLGPGVGGVDTSGSNEVIFETE